MPVCPGSFLLVQGPRLWDLAAMRSCCDLKAEGKMTAL